MAEWNQKSSGIKKINMRGIKAKKLRKFIAVNHFYSTDSSSDMHEQFKQVYSSAKFKAIYRRAKKNGMSAWALQP